MIDQNAVHSSPCALYIIMSGYQDFAYVKSLKFRVADYLLKPVNKVELGNILESYLKLKNQRSRDGQSAPS